MFAGSLDRRVTWQTYTATKDGAGQDVKTWSTAFDTWACKANLTGAEFIQAGENVDEQTIKIQLRYRVSVSTIDRFLYEGRTYRIHSIVELGRREGLEVVGRTRADGVQVNG